MSLAAAVRTLHSALVGQLLQAGGLVAGIVGRCEVASDTCGWEELLAPFPRWLAPGQKSQAFRTGSSITEYGGKRQHRCRRTP